MARQLPLVPSKQFFFFSLPLSFLWFPPLYFLISLFPFFPFFLLYNRGVELGGVVATRLFRLSIFPALLSHFNSLSSLASLHFISSFSLGMNKFEFFGNRRFVHHLTIQSGFTKAPGKKNYQNWNSIKSVKNRWKLTSSFNLSQFYHSLPRNSSKTNEKHEKVEVNFGVQSPNRTKISKIEKLNGKNPFEIPLKFFPNFK